MGTLYLYEFAVCLEDKEPLFSNIKNLGDQSESAIHIFLCQKMMVLVDKLQSMYGGNIVYWKYEWIELNVIM